MLRKKYVFTTCMMFFGTLCLCGCTPERIYTEMPTRKPEISVPATPTETVPSEQPSLSPTEALVPTMTPQGTPTPSPLPTATPTPTASPTPTATPTPTASPTPTATPTPVPTVPTAPVAVNTDLSTYTFLINRDYPLGDAYVPEDLVVPDIPFSFSSKTLDKRKLRKVAADALEDLYHAAFKEEGLKIYGVSGYRSYDRQYEIYGTNLITRGISHTNLYSAAPGTSEHQTGLAIDVSCASIGYRLINSFANTPEGIWLRENCWRFGFILRYPQDKEHITGYAYEPWHIRYVGVPLAYYLYTNHLTLEEYYGSRSSQTLEELSDLPLIDLTSARYGDLYVATTGIEVYRFGDQSVLLNEETGLPYEKLPITDSLGNALLVDGKTLYQEVVLDVYGQIVRTEDGSFLFKKPYYDAEGNLWLDYNGSPVYLEPLWNKDGTLAYDTDGNLLYTGVVTDGLGNEFITEDGGLLLQVPLRTNGELTYDEHGHVVYYMPYTTVTGALIVDYVTALPYFPPAYSDVPHTTYPLPEDVAPLTEDNTEIGGSIE